MTIEPSDLNRRQFIKLVAGTGAGLTLGISTSGCEPSEEGGLFQPSLWLRIEDNDRITVLLAEIEMGQGVATALPMLVAEELEVSLDAIDIEPAPLVASYGYQITGGSSSVRDAWTPLREAGATAREMLKHAAARKWGVPVSDCVAASGRVHRRNTDMSLSYGALASAAARLPVPKDVVLKKRSQYTLLGQERPSRDLLGRITGKATFGSDVALPDMKVAAIKHCPVFGGTLESYEDRKIKKLAGVVSVVPLGDAIAVVADTYWQASQALREIDVKWHGGAAASIGGSQIEEMLWRALDAEGTIHRGDKAVSDALRDNLHTDKVLEAKFVVPFQAHATMEPMCCTAHVHNGLCEIWVATQAPSNARDLAFNAAFSGVTSFWHKVRRRLEVGFVDPVKVHRVEMGGGFGRRLTNDFVTQAVKIAVSVKLPVKLIWSREEDIQHDRYRPLTVHELKAEIGASGKISTWSHRFSGPRAGPAGARDIPYSIPSVYVEGHQVETPVPIGSWRSIDHSYNAFVTECFMDEVAERVGKDAISFRLDHLAEHPRLSNVLRLAAKRAGWFQARTNGHHLGVAAHQSFGSFVAQIAEVSVDANGRISVHKVVCVMDCGQMINPDTVRAQVEGSIAFGLSGTLSGAITISDGKVDQSNFHDFKVLRMNEMPELDILLVDSGAEPGGVGEPAVPPLAAAVANAVYSATGKRHRQLPISRAKVA